MSKNTNELNLKHLVKLFFIAFAIFAAMCLFTLFGFSFVKNGEPQNQKKETSENTTEVWENENIDFYETENKNFTPTSSAEITEENADDYLVISENGNVKLYLLTKNGEKIYQKDLEIPLVSLMDEDKKLLSDGIILNSKEALAAILEDYTS